MLYQYQSLVYLSHNVVMTYDLHQPWVVASLEIGVVWTVTYLNVYIPWSGQEDHPVHPLPPFAASKKGTTATTASFPPLRTSSCRAAASVCAYLSARDSSTGKS